MVDTHCHLNFHVYDEDRDAVIQRANDADVKRIIIPAIDIESCQEAIALASTHTAVYAALGIHPNSTSTFDHHHLDELQHMAGAAKVVSIGEIGLDYYWDKSPKGNQIQAFEAQLALAAELELPVIIHNREASEDVIQVLEAWTADLPPALQDRPGVLHSFSASAAIAEQALALGFYLGFTGPVTFKKADDLRDIARQVPAERILVETDGPYLTPTPHRGKRNEPAYIPFIVDRIAGLKGMSQADMAKITTENAQQLFRFPLAGD